MKMKPRRIYPKLRLIPPNEKIKVYSGASVNKGFYKRNLMKAKTIYMDNSINNYNKKKEEQALNQLLNRYYQDYNKLAKFHKILTKPVKKERNAFDFNQYECKKKNISSLFFNYDIKFNEDKSFQFTDDLINSMNNGKNNTLIKSLQIKNDYEKRLYGNKRNKIKYNNFIDDNEDNYDDENENDNENYNENDEYNNNKRKLNNMENNSGGIPGTYLDRTKLKLSNINDIKERTEEYDENIFYLNDGDNLKDDNFLNFKTNIYSNNDYLPLFNEIIQSNFNDNYEAPLYEIPQSVLNEEKEEENKKNNEKLQEKPETSKKQKKIGELKMFKDMIIDNEYPGFEQMTDPYFQTNYKPPPCFPKLPEDEEEEKEENDEYGYDDFGYKEEDKKIIEDDNNVGNDMNLLENIIKDDKYPLFKNIINPRYQTNYIPPDIFPKIESVTQEKEKENDTDNYGEGDFIDNNKEEDEYNDFEQ